MSCEGIESQESYLEDLLYALLRQAWRKGHSPSRHLLHHRSGLNRRHCWKGQDMAGIRCSRLPVFPYAPRGEVLGIGNDRQEMKCAEEIDDEAKSDGEGMARKYLSSRRSCRSSMGRRGR